MDIIEQVHHLVGYLKLVNVIAMVGLVILWSAVYIYRRHLTRDIK